jgi:hypothetical protein
VINFCQGFDNHALLSPDAKREINILRYYLTIEVFAKLALLKNCPEITFDPWQGII